MVNKPKRQKFKKDYSAKLFRIAENDLYAAEFLTKAPKCRPELIIYQTQQVVEKSIKAVLVSDEKLVPMTHNIEVLMSELSSEDFNILPEGAAELTKFATIKRYTEGDESFDQSDIEASIKMAQIFLNWAKQKIKIT
jgi:HEPN domain-containing protein